MAHILKNSRPKSSGSSGKGMPRWAKITAGVLVTAVLAVGGIFGGRAFLQRIEQRNDSLSGYTQTDPDGNTKPGVPNTPTDELNEAPDEISGGGENGGNGESSKADDKLKSAEDKMKRSQNQNDADTQFAEDLIESEAVAAKTFEKSSDSEIIFDKFPPEG